MANFIDNKNIVRNFLLFFTWLLFAGAVNSTIQQKQLFEKLDYSILEGSRISVLGSTNINEFTCFSDEKYSHNKVEFQFDNLKNSIQFKDAILKVPVVSLDCGNAAMNSNLCRTLKGDKFPFITVEILQAKSRDGKSLKLSGITTLIANVRITMAGESKLHDILFTGKQTSSGQYYFSGLHSLTFSDYHLEPPEALFGLVKVNDLIAVKFALNISANVLIVQ
ncbi:MAG: YceI family protein [Chitinophagales bacterium]